MKKAIIAGTFVATLVLGGGAYAAWYYGDTERAKRAVQEQLVDPASTIFSAVEHCDDGGKLVYITGLVNARNSMGGMTGKRRFLAQAIGNGFISTIETGDMFDHPNLGDKFVKAREYAKSHPMSCKRVEELASAEYTSAGRIDPNEDDMSPVDGNDASIPGVKDGDYGVSDMPLIGNVP